MIATNWTNWLRACTFSGTVVATVTYHINYNTELSWSQRHMTQIISLKITNEFITFNIYTQASVYKLCVLWIRRQKRIREKKYLEIQLNYIYILGGEFIYVNYVYVFFGLRYLSLCLYPNLLQPQMKCETNLFESQCRICLCKDWKMTATWILNLKKWIWVFRK